MGHEATSPVSQQRGSAMGAHYRHTTPEMALALPPRSSSDSRSCWKCLSRPSRPHPEPLNPESSCAPLLGAFAAGQRQIATARSIPLLSPTVR
jgi:hypothetical protein